MTLRAGVVVAGLGVLLSIAALSAQEPAEKASIEGIVTRTGAGTPIMGARVTITPTARGRGGTAAAPASVEALVLAAQEAAGGLSPELVGGGGFVGGSAGRGAPPPPIPGATTDDKGHFSFPNLDPGTYRLQVQANGYVPQQYGQRYTNGPATSVNLASGQAKTDVSISLTPAGNISGRLRDVNEQPIPNVPVQLLRPTYQSNGERTLQVVSTGRTDDRGEYRIYWVTPGRYFVRAGMTGDSTTALILAGAGPGIAGAQNPNEVQAPVGLSYFPGVPDVSGARAVEVPAGVDLTAVDWTLPSKPARHRVRGRLIDARTGRAPAQAEVVILPFTPGFSANPDGLEEAFGFGLGLGRQYNPATGVIEFRNVAPGIYTIVAMMQEMPPGFEGFRGRSEFGIDTGPADIAFLRGVEVDGIGPQGPSMTTGSITVAVSDTDVEDVVLAIAPSGSLTGHIRLDGEFPAPAVEPQRGGARGGLGGGLVGAAGGRGAPQRMRVQLAAVGGGATRPFDGGMSTAMAGTDGAFRLNNVGPGAYRISVAAIPPNAYLKSALFDGADVLNTPLVITGMAAGTLDLIVSANSGQIQGNLTDDRSEAVPSAQVVLVPSRARGRADLYKTVVTDAAGHFTINGVAPGEYKLFSWQALDPFSWFDPEVLERYEAQGSPVSVAESGLENANVKLIPPGGAQ